MKINFGKKKKKKNLDQNLTQMMYPNDFSDLLTSPLGIRLGFVTSGICGNLKRKKKLEVGLTQNCFCYATDLNKCIPDKLTLYIFLHHRYVVCL